MRTMKWEVPTWDGFPDCQLRSLFIEGAQWLYVWCDKEARLNRLGPSRLVREKQGASEGQEGEARPMRSAERRGASQGREEGKWSGGGEALSRDCGPGPCPQSPFMDLWILQTAGAVGSGIRSAEMS